MLSTHGAAARDSSSSSPFVDLEEQPEGGLRHCTPSCKALSVVVRQWWQGTSQAPAHHPPKPATLHQQHKQWFLLTIYEKQVPTVGSNSATKCKLMSPLHKVNFLPQHPILAFTKHLFLIKITCKSGARRWQAAERMLHLWEAPPALAAWPGTASINPAVRWGDQKYFHGTDLKPN